MNKVVLAMIAVMVMGAGCARTATVNTNASANEEVGSRAGNTNMAQETDDDASAPTGNLNINTEVDDLLKDANDEQASEASGDESDLTTAETLDLDAMTGASGNY